ncbi:MAG TPA: hypothetical protein VLD67_13325, partial [Vicinamibacterales bacterium]|nr:hypothetical protein [Vicinamibacterales bacterium]
MSDEIRRQLTESRRAVTDLETEVVRRDADLAALRKRLAQLKRSGRFDEADSVTRQIGETEKNLAALAERLTASRTRAADLFGSFINVPDPADLLGQLETGQAIALLPVRLETRFRQSEQGMDLLVRFYPDDIHVETHEQELTEEEVEFGRAFHEATRAADDLPEDEQRAARLAAWATLAGRFGPERAAWVARALTPVENSDDTTGDDSPNGDGGGNGDDVDFPEAPLHAEPWT